MPCEHIREANELIDRARTILNWKDDLNPFGDALGGAATFGIWTAGRFANNLKGAKEAMREANDILGDAKKETLSCKCYEESRTGRAEEQVRRAEGRLKQLEEENLSQKLSNKKETLDRFINGNRLRDNRNEVKNLRNAYERLFRIQENDDIRNLRNNIETIRDNLLDAGIEFDDLERIRELCEEISKLQIQSEQEFVAQIQVPLHQFRFN